jgi:hypothetical protein
MRDTLRAWTMRSNNAARYRPVLESFEDRLVPAVISISAGEETLRAAILTANINGDASNTIELSGGVFSLSNISAGDIVIQNSSNLPAKTLEIVGVGPVPSKVRPSVAVWNDRIFQVVGSTMTVTFKNFEISGGHAIDGGGVGGETALGGGILIHGAHVTLEDMIVKENTAAGAAGINGLRGDIGFPDGGDGDDGREAKGGGIYMESGSLSVINSTFDNNVAQGGVGGDGGEGILDGESPFSFDWTGNFFEHQLQYQSGADNEVVVGNGGRGGRGGDARGGGVYVAGGTVTIESSAFTYNYAIGGDGGKGGKAGDTHDPLAILNGAPGAKGTNGVPGQDGGDAADGGAGGDGGDAGFGVGGGV